MSDLDSDVGRLSSPSGLGQRLSEALDALCFEENRLANQAQIVQAVVDALKTPDDTCQPRDVIDHCFLSLQDRFATVEDFRCFLLAIYEQGLALIRSGTLSHDLEGQIEISTDRIQFLIHQIERAPLDELDRQIDAIDPSEPLEFRYAHSQTIKTRLMELLSGGRFLFRLDRQGGSVLFPSLPQKPISWEEFPARNPDQNLENWTLYFCHSTGVTVLGAFGRLLRIIHAIEREKQFFDTVGYVDKKQLETDRLKWGAKGANLKAIERFLADLKQTRFRYLNWEITIPRFHCVEAEVYNKWRRGEDVTLLLYQIYLDSGEGEKPLMVRSSAVFSEDGETMTGAGIYDTIALDDGHDFEAFQAAIFKVYESCESDRAIRYRAKHGVEKESMGLVIQERIVNADLHTVNSTRPGGAKIIQVEDAKGRSPFIVDVSLLDKDLFGPAMIGLSQIGQMTRVPYDHSRLADEKINPTIAALIFARLLEEYYGQPVQLEFSLTRFTEEGGSPSVSRSRLRTKIDFFQARPLPASMFTQIPVEFPKDQTPLYECPAEGRCDAILDVLNFDVQNGTRTGFMVYYRSFEHGSQRELFRSTMPQKGVVLIVSPSVCGHGHLETLALEEGLVLLFNRDEDLSSSSPEMRKIRQRLKEALFFVNGDFLGFKKVRVVSDGETARIYEVTKAE